MDNKVKGDVYMKLRRTVVALALAAALTVPVLATPASAATMNPGPWVNPASNLTQSGYWYGPMWYGSMGYGFGRNTNWQASGGWGGSYMPGQGWWCW